MNDKGQAVCPGDVWGGWGSSRPDAGLPGAAWIRIRLLGCLVSLVRPDLGHLDASG